MPSPPPPVCTCGYDLAGLPVDAATKCPECGAVIAEIEPPASRFHHWGWLLIAGMTPALGYGVAELADRIFPGSLDDMGSVLLIAVVGFWCLPLVSFPAFACLMVRSLRARSFGGQCVAVVLGIVLSLLANATAIILMAMPFA